MQYYSTTVFYKFPASECGGLLIWYAEDEDHLETLITSALEKEYQQDDCLRTIEEMMESVDPLDTPEEGGLVAGFFT